MGVSRAGHAAMGLAAVLLAAAAAQGAARERVVAPSRPVYEFEIKADAVRMADGTRLAASFFLPRPRSRGERFPVLLELLPYRKDDSFYLRDYPLYSYFARRGFACVKVDVRGTGASDGPAPEREYSERELDDAVELIGQLAREPWSNGNVGMWGISWGGFNAIQVAMRKPPALKAILAAHASDNVFEDSVDYVDGAFHVDPYHLQVHSENGLPRPPDYPLDEAYFKERFDVRPWFFTYMKHQVDGEFWRKNALRRDYSQLRVPAYLIAGLLDGYRDAALRILEHATPPVKVEIGPWNHAWPNDGEPGPNYEWGYEATRWWDRWLKGRDTGIADGKQLTLFVREGHPPDALLKTTPGHWRTEEWPIRRTSWLRLHAADDRTLRREPAAAGTASLKYLSSSGWVAGDWWGEATGDMRPDDAGSLTFDSPPLDRALEIVGFPRVSLRAAVDAPTAHFVARLEDVQPDGSVSLVAGAVLAASRRHDPLQPEPFLPDRSEDLALDLHFTTWTFQPGHRIRLAVSNAQFPMIWPTPYPMTATLRVGDSATTVDLPVIPFEERPRPVLRPPESREKRPDARYSECQSWPEGRLEIGREPVTSKGTYQWEGECGWEIGPRRYRVSEKDYYETNDARPAESRYRGDESYAIEMPRRSLELKTVLEVRSDETSFLVTFTRRLIQNETLLRERQWVETFPRQYQ